MHRPISLRRLALALLAGWLALGTGPLRAQYAQPAAIERFGPVAPEKRAALQRELAQNAQVLEAQSAVLKAVSKLVSPAVVHIEADVPEAVRGSARDRDVEEAGSGVLMDYKGRPYLLTNRHVIRGAKPEDIRVYLADGRLVSPARVLEDADSDVAVLEVDSPNLVTAPLGDSDDLEIGDFVLAIGSPFGLSHSVTMGIVSAKGRRDLHLGDDKLPLQDFLQTDAAINPGNSGGPLVNLRGEVVGINTAIASNSGGNEGIGFSIPINMFGFVARQLIDHGKVQRAYLGVGMNTAFGPAMAAELGLSAVMGAHITKVEPASPAAAVGLRVGDVILEFNHVPVEDANHLINLVSISEAGHRVPLLVFRDRRPMKLDVELAERP